MYRVCYVDRHGNVCPWFQPESAFHAQSYEDAFELAANLMDGPQVKNGELRVFIRPV